MPPLSERPGIELSAEEVAALCYHLGVDTPSGWASLVDHQPAHIAALVRETATSALRARRLVAGDGPEVEVLPAVRELLQICAQPAVLARVVHRDRFGVDSWLFAGDLDATVAQRALPGRVHRFVPIATDELSSGIANAAGLSSDGVSSPSDALRVSRHEYDHVVQQAGRGAVDRLPLSFDGDVGRSFVDALALIVATSSLTIVHSPAEDLTVGGALTWFDCGAAGLWQVPEPIVDDPATEGAPFEGSEETVEVRRVSAGMLLEELRSYLPSLTSVSG